jgi:hypothetical protein
MKSFFLLTLILASSIITSCSTFRWRAEITDVSTGEPNVPQFVKIQPTKIRNHFMVTNLTDKVVTVVYRQSVIQADGISLRVISGETRGINRDRDSPDVVIAPQTTAEISLYSEDSANSEKIIKGQFKELKFRIAVKLGDQAVQYAVMDGGKSNEFTTEISQNEKLWCYVTGIFYGGYCWLIKPDDEDRLAAQKKANELYQGRAKDIIYIGKE